MYLTKTILLTQIFCVLDWKNVKYYVLYMLTYVLDKCKLMT